MPISFPIYNTQLGTNLLEGLKAGQGLRETDIKMPFLQPTLAETLRQLQLQTAPMEAKAKYAMQMEQALLAAQQQIAPHMQAQTNVLGKELQWYDPMRRSEIGARDIATQLSKEQLDELRALFPFKEQKAAADVFSDPVLSRMNQFNLAQRTGSIPSDLLSALTGGQAQQEMPSQAMGGQSSLPQQMQGAIGTRPQRSSNMASALQNYLLTGGLGTEEEVLQKEIRKIEELEKAKIRARGEGEKLEGWKRIEQKISTLNEMEKSYENMEKNEPKLLASIRKSPMGQEYMARYSENASNLYRYQTQIGLDLIKDFHLGRMTQLEFNKILSSMPNLNMHPKAFKKAVSEMRGQLKEIHGRPVGQEGTPQDKPDLQAFMEAARKANPGASNQMPEPQPPAQSGQEWYQKYLPQRSDAPQSVAELVQTPFIQGTFGAGDALAKMYSLGSLQPKYGEGTAYDVGQVAGNVGGYLLPGAGLKAAAPAASLLGRAMAAKGVAGALRSVAGGSLAGMATSPEDRLGGAGLGALYAGAGAAVPYLFKGGKALWGARPQAKAKSVIEGLTEGRGQKQIAEDLITSLKKGYDKRIKESSKYFGSIEKQVGSKNIYEPLSSEGKYLDIHENAYEHMPSLKKMHKEFMQNPTYKKARDFDSHLGRTAAEIRSGTVGALERGQLESIYEAQNSLRSDVKDFLHAVDPKLVKKFDKGMQHYVKHVAPYKNIKRLHQLVAKEGEYGEKAKILPKNISDLFKVHMTARDPGIAEEATNIQKIIKDLGPKAKKNVLAAELGKIRNITPDKLLEAQGQLSEKGFDFYQTPEFEKGIESLAKSLKRKSQLKGAALIGGGLYGLKKYSTRTRHFIEGGE